MVKDAGCSRWHLFITTTMAEAKITVRFWIIGIIMAVITIAMLKLR